MTNIGHHLRGIAFGVSAMFAASTLAAAPAVAWEPTEEVELIIHAGPTSSTNTFVRAVEKELDKLLPKGANATNVVGAGGDRARRYLLEREGNPHVMGSLTPSNVNNPILAGADYGAEDFTPVAILVVEPMTLVVNAKSPYKTLDDLIEAARKNPGKIVQGGGDVGETDSLHHVMLEEKAGVDMTFTPFKSKGIIELLGGHVDFVMGTPGKVTRYVESGDFRVLATSVPTYPNVPTMKEAGYDIQILQQYRGFWMPPGVSKEAQDYYIGQLKKVAETESFKQYVEKNGLMPSIIAGEELGKMLKAEQEAYRKLDTQLGLLKKK